MPEPWVIFISVELFWPQSLSYFPENAWVIQKAETWVILDKTVKFLMWNSFQNAWKPEKLHNLWVICNGFKHNYGSLSYFSINLPKICRNFELFFQRAWVIFKTLSYFASEILELFSRRRKKKPGLESIITLMKNISKVMIYI